MPPKPRLSSLRDGADSCSKKAKEVQLRIRELENERYLGIGREVAKYHNKNWSAFHQPRFQAFVKKPLEAQHTPRHSPPYYSQRPPQRPAPLLLVVQAPRMTSVSNPKYLSEADYPIFVTP